jgi:Protein of unknown function (DUF3108)
LKRRARTLLHIAFVAGALAVAPHPAPGVVGEPAPADSVAVKSAADAGAGGADSLDYGSFIDEEELSRFAKVPWRIGEYFQFSIDWNGLNGGSSLMQVQNLQRVGGRRAYRIVSKTESNSFVSKFYKVRDRAESYIDAESLYTLRFIKHLREGGYKSDVDIRFDQPSRRATYSDGTTFVVSPGVHDVLSAFYFVRTRPLPDGATMIVPTHDNKKSYEMEVKVHKRERIEVPAGKFNCVLVEPILKSEGVFKSKGSILVWLTDDERRMPVLVRTKVPVGSINVALTDYRLFFERKK